MSTSPPYVDWYGRDEAPEHEYVLRAGPMEALLIGSDLCHVRVGTVEVAQRVYVAVRDAVWKTVPGEVSDLCIQQTADSFRVDFRMRHTFEDIDYAWAGSIEGSPEGVITYTMAGEAKCAFTHARIGFNIYHPISEYVGRHYWARTEDGAIEGDLPAQIAPQLVRDGTLTAMFDHFDALRVDLPGGIQARFGFEGDYFEMQDHRNWSDANYKTYGTPLSLGFPTDADAGEKFHQRITLSFEGTPPPRVANHVVEVEVGASTGLRLPALGLGMRSDGEDLSRRTRRLLQAVTPAHVRMDLHMNGSEWTAELERGLRTCRELDAGAEIAVFVTDASADELNSLAERLGPSEVSVHRVLVFEEAEGLSVMRGTTPAGLVEMVRVALEGEVGDAPFAGGTNQFFNEVNRDRPDPEPLDAVAYSLNPQVHESDDRSLMANLATIGDIVNSTRAICGELPIFITPVTFVGRAGPFPAGPPKPEGLPGQVDVRQAALFGAAWTVGCMQAMAAAGVDSVTYFETSGWRGILETDEGPPLPELFPSEPGDVYPVYHVFADVASWPDGELASVQRADSSAVAVLALRSHEDTTHLLISNLTHRVQRVRLRGLDGDVARIRVLDDTNRAEAMSRPMRYREQPPIEAPLRDGCLDLCLAPYATAKIDTGRERP